MGGDEIHVGCWNSSELITDWLQEQVDRFSLNEIKKTFVKGHGINEEDFMWMWSHYQNRSYANFVNSTSLANLSQTPNVILWNSHLTDDQFLHYLVS